MSRFVHRICYKSGHIIWLAAHAEAANPSNDGLLQVDQLVAPDRVRRVMEKRDNTRPSLTTAHWIGETSNAAVTHVS